MLRGKIKNEYWRKLDMNKQEMLDEIKKTKGHLDKLEKMLKDCEYERWKPRENEKFYLVDKFNEVFADRVAGIFIEKLYKTYNCFHTKEQAETEAEKILVRRMLEDIARRLNKGETIDWYNNSQAKHCIELYCNNIITNFYLAHKTQGTVYCLDKNFRDVAIQEIGEERLKTYLRGE